MAFLNHCPSMTLLYPLSSSTILPAGMDQRPAAMRDNTQQDTHLQRDGLTPILQQLSLQTVFYPGLSLVTASTTAVGDLIILIWSCLPSLTNSQSLKGDLYPNFAQREHSFSGTPDSDNGQPAAVWAPTCLQGSSLHYGAPM